MEGKAELPADRILELDWPLLLLRGFCSSFCHCFLHRCVCCFLGLLGLFFCLLFGLPGLFFCFLFRFCHVFCSLRLRLGFCIGGGLGGGFLPGLRNVFLGLFFSCRFGA